jgi:hypothetical protein
VIATALLVGFRPTVARPYLAAAVSTSLALSVLGLWASVTGAVIDLLLLLPVGWAPGQLVGPRPRRA